MISNTQCKMFIKIFKEIPFRGSLCNLIIFEDENFNNSIIIIGYFDTPLDVYNAKGK